MNENPVYKEMQLTDTEAEQTEKINASLTKLLNKKSKFLFCIPDSPTPNASVYELYFHASVVKNMGFEVVILTEKGDAEVPSWIEKELTQHKHIAMSDPKLTVGPEDVMVIPEVYSNVMEQTNNLPCLRVGLLQSVDYMLNALIPGVDWSAFGISNIITTSPQLKEWIDLFYVNKFNTEVYNLGIPDYFEKPKIPKKPIISIVGRNPNEISKFVKLFYSRFPQFSWITFDPMLTKSKPPQAMRRVDFAKRLKENFAGVWIDRISSFGTFPLECMKCATIPIGLRPDIVPEYLIERDEQGNPVKLIDNCGIWTDNYYDLVTLTGDALNKFLDDAFSDEFYDSMEKIASKYSQEDSEKRLSEIYEGFINKRIELLKSALSQIAPNPSMEPPVSL